MILFLDTNIILDILLARDPFALKSMELLQEAEKMKCSVYISASSATDIFYLLSKYLKDKQTVYSIFGELLNIVTIADVTDSIVRRSYNENWDDFEDAVQYNCAKSIHSEYIITRNKRDFTKSDIPVLSPEEYLDKV
ncbi:MAG TPA: PIN domain-containing protein [Treponemataceae bacterium]|nr:PIN domain-containing protein [Treponemataceae bacterium]